MCFWAAKFKNILAIIESKRNKNWLDFNSLNNNRFLNEAVQKSSC